MVVSFEDYLKMEFEMRYILQKIEKSEPECNKAAVLKSLNNDISYKIHKA